MYFIWNVASFGMLKNFLLTVKLRRKVTHFPGRSLCSANWNLKSVLVFCGKIFFDSLSDDLTKMWNGCILSLGSFLGFTQISMIDGVVALSIYESVSDSSSKLQRLNEHVESFYYYYFVPLHMYACALLLVQILIITESSLLSLNPSCKQQLHKEACIIVHWSMQALCNLQCIVTLCPMMKSEINIYWFKYSNYNYKLNYEYYHY